VLNACFHGVQHGCAHQCQLAATLKVHQNDERTSQVTEVKALIEEEKETRRRSMLIQKELEERQITIGGDDDQVTDVKVWIEEEKECRHCLLLIQRELEDKLKTVHGAGDGAKKMSKCSFQVESSSSSCVKGQKVLCMFLLQIISFCLCLQGDYLIPASSAYPTLGFAPASMSVHHVAATTIAQSVQVPAPAPSSLHLHPAGMHPESDMSFMDLLNSDLHKFDSNFEFLEPIGWGVPLPAITDEACPLLPPLPVPPSPSPPPVPQMPVAKKRRQQEVDKNDILPTGTHRMKRATARADYVSK
jgi:hypothetical protein